MKKTWKPIVAGILGILSGLCYFIPFIMLCSVSEDAELEERELAGMLAFISILFSPFTLLAVVAGICALVRSAWGLALVCLIIFFIFQIFFFVGVIADASSILFWFGVLGSGIGIIMPPAAVVLLLLSEDEFRHGKAGEGEAGH
jgi:hypothetical protein